jgi:hypothetical protein
MPIRKQIHAQYNHGRWIAICPVCAEDGIVSALEVEAGSVFVCPGEYPQIGAETYIPNPRMEGALDRVPDHALREEARRSAIEAGNCYDVIFPPERREIEAILRYRPLHARNWFAGTTVEELHRENEKRGLKHD